MTLTEIISSIFLLGGAGFVLLASLGLWRFDDLYSRIHASTKAITLGVLLVIVAAALRMGDSADLLKLMLAAVFQLISAPVAGHLLGRSAYWSGTSMSEHTVIDQLKNKV